MTKSRFFMKLVIVESPTKAKTISQFLEKGFKVESSYGHIRDLPEKRLGVDIAHNFKPDYVIPSKAKPRIQKLKEATAKSEGVILATDEDREGEAIAWHLIHALGLAKSKKEVERIVFHEITRRAIEKALQNPRDIDLNLVDAQQARRILDRLVGYKLSPFLWKKVAKGLSAGRVQSVAVRLIVEREREIAAFKPEEYWTVEALLQKNPKSKVQNPNKFQISNDKIQKEFTALLIKKHGKPIPKLGIKNKKEADKIVKDLKGAKYQVVAIERKETKRNPLPPFTTSTLQQEAARRLGFSAKQTMRLAQQLYEGVSLGKKGATGLITYMRTDSLNLSRQFLAGASKFINGQLGSTYHQSRVFKTRAKRAQEAHEAVRPTLASRTPESVKQYLDPGQFKLYNLVWRRAIASQMTPAIFDATKVDVQAKNYLFRANGSVIKFDGFLKVYPLKTKENILPELTNKEILRLIKLISSQHFTQPPPRYSEATLVKALEEHGIGRPSTYAPIISVIQARGYVEKSDQRKFVPTEIGTIVNDLLVKHFSKVVDIKFTAHMEDDLDEIATGKKKWVPVIREFYKPFAVNLKKKYEKVEKKKMVQETDRRCPKCGKPLVIRLGRFGKFYACTGFPDCKFTEGIANKTGVKCPKCQKGEIIAKRSKKGRVFYACNQWPKCDYALWNKPTGEKCPKCDSLLVEAGKSIKCSNKECDYKVESLRGSGSDRSNPGP